MSIGLYMLLFPSICLCIFLYTLNIFTHTHTHAQGLKFYEPMHCHLLSQVMLVGDSGVGKTCLLVRFKDGAFLAGSFISTVGIDFRVSISILATLCLPVDVIASLAKCTLCQVTEEF